MDSVAQYPAHIVRDTLSNVATIDYLCDACRQSFTPAMALLDVHGQPRTCRRYVRGDGAVASDRWAGHKSLLMVRRYIREGNLFRGNAAAYLGL